MPQDNQMLSDNELVAEVMPSRDLPGTQLLPAVVENVLGNLSGQAFHNFVGSKLEVWKQIAKVTGPDTMPADKKLDTSIRLVSFYVHNVTLDGPTSGELRDATRCVLVDSDQQAYSFVSDGVAGDLGRIIATFGMGPYNPPIPVKVVQYRTRKGFNAYSIQPA